MENFKGEHHLHGINFKYVGGFFYFHISQAHLVTNFFRAIIERAFFVLKRKNQQLLK